MTSKKRSRVDDDDEDYIPTMDVEPPSNFGRGRGSNAGQRGAKKAKEAVEESAIDRIVFEEENCVFRDYSTELTLKPDHEKRPIWITKDNLIYLEAFSPIYQQACDFLVTIAEPEARPEFIHTYKLTQNSLYAAVAVSITTESIIKVLNRLCKTNVPREVVDFIHQSTYTFGKAKLVLKDNKFYIESQFPEVLRELLKNPNIRNARELHDGNEALIESSAPVEDIRNKDYTKLAYDTMEAEEEVAGGDAKEFRTVSFMIRQSEVQVKSVMFHLNHIHP